jgi:hypothetical protein
VCFPCAQIGLRDAVDATIGLSGTDGYSNHGFTSEPTRSRSECICSDQAANPRDLASESEKATPTGERGLSQYDLSANTTRIVAGEVEPEIIASNREQSLTDSTQFRPHLPRGILMSAPDFVVFTNSGYMTGPIK